MTEIMIDPVQMQGFAQLTKQQMDRVLLVDGWREVLMPSGDGGSLSTYVPAASTFVNADITFPWEVVEAGVPWLNAERQQMINEVESGGSHVILSVLVATLRSMVLQAQENQATAMSGVGGVPAIGWTADLTSGSLVGAPLTAGVTGPMDPTLFETLMKIQEDQSGSMTALITGTDYVGDGQFRSRDGVTGSFATAYGQDKFLERLDQERIDDRRLENQRIEDQRIEDRFEQQRQEDDYYERQRELEDSYDD